MNWNIYFQAFTVRTWRKRLSNLNTFLTPHIYWGIHITICVNYNQHIVNLEETIAELNRRFFGISSEHSKNISLPADEESDMAEDISEDDAKESPFLLTNC